MSADDVTILTLMRARLAQARWPSALLTSLTLSACQRSPAPAPQPSASAAAHAAGEAPHAAAGTWCGTIAQAEPLGYSGSPVLEGCVRFIDGEKQPWADAGAYAGLPRDVRGFLDQQGTLAARSARHDACCYHWREKVAGGRPLTEGETAWLAGLEVSDAWRGVGSSREPPLEPNPALASAWLDDTLTEHASIAAFHRVALELLQLGAPPELLLLVQQAATDEVVHAQLCLELARAYGAPPLSPGPLRIPPLRPPSLVGFALDTLLEGVIAETSAALGALRAAAACTVPRVRAVLTRIADDEVGHAALAFQLLDWCLARAPREVTGALRAARLRLPAQLQAQEILGSPEPAPGRLTSAELRQARLDAWELLIAPELDQRLASLGQWASVGTT